MDTIESHELVDGQYVTRQVSGMEIMRRERERRERDAKKNQPGDETPSQRSGSVPIGLLSTTLVHSPVVNQIIPARIRGSIYNDLLFIGEDYVHIAEILTDGRLRRAGTKANFDSRIRAAAVIGKRLEEGDDLFSVIKLENVDESEPDRLAHSTDVPPQMLVTSMASGELLFLYAEQKATYGSLSFHESRVQLPMGRSPLWQPGKHLVVDPRSRAIAVGSIGGRIILYKLKHRSELEQEISNQSGGWNPVSHDLPIDVGGVILQMAFLTPLDDSHAIMAAVVCDREGMSRVKCFEVDLTEPLQHASLLVDHPIDEENRVTTHLIPTLYEPNFLLISGNKAIHWRDVLTGSATQAMVASATAPAVEDPKNPQPRYPANSSRLPIYSAWTRGERHHNKWKEKQNDVFYLIREDGLIHQLESLGGHTFTISQGGRFDCTGSSAFTSFLANNKYTDPDYLVVAGQGSNGQIVQIGSIVQSGEFQPRKMVMAPTNVGSISNWAPVSDFIIASADGGASHTNRPASIYMTSGSQPFGAISELRIGIEARVDISVRIMDRDEMAGFTSIWPLTYERSNGQTTILFFLSAPDDTLLLQYSDSGDESDALQALDCEVARDEETLFAATLPSGNIVHATRRSLAVYALDDEDGVRVLRKRVERSQHGSYLRITCLEEYSVLLVAIQYDDSYWLELEVMTEEYEMVQFALHFNAVKIDSYPTALQLFHDSGSFGALIADGEGKLHLYRIPKTPDDGPPEHFGSLAIPRAHDQDFSPLVESIAILVNEDRGVDRSSVMIVAGLRDGRLLKVASSRRRSLNTSSFLPQLSLWEQLAELFHPELTAKEFISVGHEPIRILRAVGPERSATVLLCGSDVCRINYQGGGIKDLAIDSVVFTEESEPDLVQMPFHTLALHCSSRPSQTTLLGTTGSSFLVAELDTRRKSLPRRMPLEATACRDNVEPIPGGSPSKLCFLKSLNLLAIATTISQLQLHARIPEQGYRGRRAIRGAIKFMRLDDPSACIDQNAFQLLPGERVTAMDEWPEPTTTDDNNSAYLWIGTRSATKSRGLKGRILLVKIWLNTDLAPCLKVIKLHKFSRRSVTAVKTLAPHNSNSTSVSHSSLAKSFEQLHTSEGAGEPGRSAAALGSATQARLAVGTDDGLEQTIDIYEVFEDRIRFVTRGVLPSSAIRISMWTAEQMSVITADDSWQSYTLNGFDVMKLSMSDEVMRKGADHLHLALEGPVDKQLLSIVLVSDREGHVTGLTTSEPGRSIQLARRTAFTANMPQAIMRLQSGNIQPLWRQRLPRGVKVNNIIGAATDGSFYGFSVLDTPALLLLKFLQNLITYHDQGERSQAGQYHGAPVTIDPEFPRKRLAPGSPLNHVSGDTLMCLLDPHGGELLRKVMSRPHWEDNHSAAHVGNTVEDRSAKFRELVEKMWHPHTFTDLEYCMDIVLDWLREVLAPTL